jgi:DNA polymerase elongation subunit (family B)
VRIVPAQVGKRKSNKVSIRGRVVLDVYLWMLNNYRLEEYKLDSVCRLYLPEGRTKEDLHFTAITPKATTADATATATATATPYGPQTSGVANDRNQ